MKDEIIEEYVEEVYRNKEYGLWREEYLKYFVLTAYILGALLTCFGCLCLLSPISAAPYQLNLTTGELIDLNVTNETANITIIIYNYTLNNTNTVINNITNITNSNVTIVNETEFVNKSYYYNESYGFNNETLLNYYTKDEVNGKFLLTSIPYVSQAPFNELTGRVDTINNTIWNGSVVIKFDKEVSTKATIALWVGIFAFLLAVVIFILLKRDEVI